MNTRVLAYKLALKLMTYAGDIASAEWNRIVEEKKSYESRYVGADNERWKWYEKHRKLIETLKLVDGLISQKQVEYAQQQLRVAIIEAGERFGSSRG